MTMELEECIKDGFDDSLRDYIQSEEYVSAKQQERRGLAYLESLLNDSQINALHSFLDAATNTSSMLQVTHLQKTNLFGLPYSKILHTGRKEKSDD